MHREQIYNSIILKKTPFNEADEIVTVFTAEQGKMRFLAKSVKLAKSKLQNNLQSLFLSELRIANSKNGKLNKIIGSLPVETFLSLRVNMRAIKAAYSASEIIMKFLPDEQANLGVYKLFILFLKFLNNPAVVEAQIEAGLLSFKIKFLELIGLGISHPQQTQKENLVFDANKGGFFSNGVSGLAVSQNSLDVFLFLREVSYKQMPKYEQNMSEIKTLIDNLLEYQLERELKAEKSMAGVV